MLLESVATKEIDAFEESWSPNLHTPKYPSLRSLALFMDSMETIEQPTWMTIDIPGWRALETLTLVKHGKVPTLLYDTIAARNISDHPIRQLKLSEAIIYRLGDDLNRLRAQVEVGESEYSDRRLPSY